MNSFSGCPGSRAQVIEKKKENRGDAPTFQSELRQWPVQLTLVPPTAGYFQDANLLLAADCIPFAYPNFHRDMLKDHSIAIACPKLDDTEPYIGKLTHMFKENNIKKITVAIMEVPCCRGLLMITQQALEQSGKEIPLELIVIGIDGERRN